MLEGANMKKLETRTADDRDIDDHLPPSKRGFKKYGKGNLKTGEQYTWPDEEKCPEKNHEDPSKEEQNHTEEIALLLKEAVSRYNRESMGIIRALKAEILGHKRHIERLQSKARYVQMMEK